MKLVVQTPTLDAEVGELGRQLATEFTEALRTLTRRTEKELEALTVSAGLSRRISRTWQSKVYPDGRASMNAGAIIWSTAPGPMRAFTEGAVIRGKDGGFLAIPTDEVLKVRGRGLGGETNKRITPGGFTRATGIKLYLVKGDGGIGFLIGERFIAGGAGPNMARRGGFRAATPGRLRKAMRGAGGGGRVEKFLAFTLVPQVTIRRRFDIKAVHAAWAAAIQRELGPAAARAIAKAQLVQAGDDSKRAVGGAFLSNDFTATRLARRSDFVSRR